MVKRLLVGLLLGGAIGWIAALALSRAGVGFDSSSVAYAAAATVGAVTGLVAGKPIWAKEGKLEALLKATVGAFVVATAMFGVRKWLSGFAVDLAAIGAGSGTLGNLPLVTLPVLGGLFGMALEIDDALGSEGRMLPPQRVDDVGVASAESAAEGAGEEREEAPPEEEPAERPRSRRES